MSTVISVIPTWKPKLLTGIEISLLLFTENEVIYVKKTGNPDKKNPLLSTIFSPLALVFFGFKVKEFKEKMKSLKGQKINVQEVIEHSGKGSYTIPYNEISQIEVKAPSFLGKGTTRIIITTKNGRKHEYNVGPADLYREYTKEELYNKIINDLKNIPKIRELVKT